jgi:hypothetical protein
MSEHGLVTHSKHSSKQNSKESKDVSLGVPSIAKGGMLSESLEEEAVEHSIDKAFSRPLEVLNWLDAEGYISGSLANSSVGGLALTKCRLSIADIRLMRNMWDNAVNEMIKTQTESIDNANLKKQAVKKLQDALKNPIEMMSKLPHALQLSMVDTEMLASWSTLQPDFMTINPEDISLKHGSNMPGDWYVLAIVDGLPDDGDEDEPNYFIRQPMEEAISGVVEVLRELCGRPSHAYAVTPLMIFRKINLSN